MADIRPPVGGINATEYISVLDIDRPEIMDELFERKGDQWYGFFMMIMKSRGFEMPVAQESNYHYEDDEYIRPIRTGARYVQWRPWPARGRRHSGRRPIPRRDESRLPAGSPCGGSGAGCCRLPGRRR